MFVKKTGEFREYPLLPPGWYRARLVDLRQGPEAGGRMTVSWEFEIIDGPHAGQPVRGLTSTSWAPSGQNRSKAVQWVEALLQRTVTDEDDPAAIIEVIRGLECRILVTTKTTATGRQVSTVIQVAPA